MKTEKLEAAEAARTCVRGGSQGSTRIFRPPAAKPGICWGSSATRRRARRFLAIIVFFSAVMITTHAQSISAACAQPTTQMALYLQGPTARLTCTYMYMRDGPCEIIRSRSPFRPGVDPTRFVLCGRFQPRRTAVREQRPLNHFVAQPGQTSSVLSARRHVALCGLCICPFVLPPAASPVSRTGPTICQ